MKRIKIYKIALWTSVQKLFKSGGDSILLLTKMALVVATVAASGTSLLAQSSIKVKQVELLDLPDLKMYEYLPQEVQDMPLELQYFNGDKNKTTTFRAMNKTFVQLFFWDASYPDHYPDLKRIYDYRAEMAEYSNVILVISKTDKVTIENVETALNRFKKEFQVDMDIACIIGNPNLDNLFKADVFPKYVQMDKESLFTVEITADQMFKTLKIK